MPLAFLTLALAMGGVPVINSDPSFRFELPEGFTDLPEGRTNANDILAFGRQTSEGEVPSVIVVSKLSGVMERKLPPPDSYGKGNSVSEIMWREEFKLHLVTTRERVGEADVTFFTVFIPLAPNAIRIRIFGDSSREEDLRTILDGVVTSLDGKTNWLTNRERLDRAIQIIAQLSGLLTVIGIGVYLFWRRRRMQCSPPNTAPYSVPLPLPDDTPN